MSTLNAGMPKRAFQVAGSLFVLAVIVAVADRPHPVQIDPFGNRPRAYISVSGSGLKPYLTPITIEHSGLGASVPSAGASADPGTTPEESA